VSSVGMLGLPHGFAPLAWMYDVPILLLVGEIADQPVAVEGRVEVRPMLPITATIDHRYVDGWHIATAMRAFREYLADPARFEPTLAIAPHLRAN
jgi:pyruvate/2-oxoglutarate dehydrogenase complex dihydrolipoamide acyltransferase (E2) component